MSRGGDVILAAFAEMFSAAFLLNNGLADKQYLADQLASEHTVQ